MRNPNPTHPVTLTAEEVQLLHQLSRVQSMPQAVTACVRLSLGANI